MAINTRIKMKRDTTANWNNAVGFIPLDGEIIIYTDYKTITEVIDNQNVTKNIPGIKIGDGNAYVQDLPFMDNDLRDALMAHIANTNVHVTLNDKSFWNNKLNYDDTLEVDNELVNETLVLNRN